ncbi:Gfo/Idh/MocA family protein [Castellaniella sp. UC4442_H9]
MSWNALIVGLGRIGMGYDLALAPVDFVYSHARALSLHREFNLVGAVDQSQNERNTFQNTYNAPAYKTIEQALEAHPVDLVVIATPTVTHGELIGRLLAYQNPKVILCEKPLSYGIKESRKILELCVENRVTLYVNYMRRSEPGAIEVKRRIENNRISGPIKGVTWYSKGFIHNGSHFFNLLEYWLGEMQHFELLSRGRTLSAHDAEPDVRVRFARGEIVFLAAEDRRFSHNAIELIAANGRLRYENGGRYIEWNGARADRNLPDYIFLDSHPEEVPSMFDHYQWHVVEQLENALRGSRADLCSGSDGLRTIEAMGSILKSRK